MKRDELLAHLRKNEIFKRTKDADLGRLADLAEVFVVPKDGRILEEGDPSEHLFVLVQGVVGVFYSSPDGVDVLVKVFGAPAVFGEMELIFGQPRQEYVECFEDALVVRLPGKVFMEYMRKDPEACFIMLKDTASRLAIAAYNERALAFLDAPTRLAGLFLTFLEAYGEDHDDGSCTLKLKLTYEMLARCLGVTQRSIDRAMTEWMKEGWVKRTAGLYTFTDVEKLEDKSDPDRIALFSKLGLLPHTAGDLRAGD
jgi:CRP-like cAMP-binding protein